MKVNVEIDCTPQEARTFFGQPDLEPFNAWLVEQMKARYEQNLELMKPEEMLKAWTGFGTSFGTSLGGQAQEQFMKMMAAAGGAGAPPSKG
ncbi:MAG: DUF6489 family protein [Caulobacteraceae bacterium]